MVMTKELPAGDLVFIHEVLQHLRNESNDQISRLLPKLGRNYKWAIITGNVPMKDPFVSNLDIEAGEFMRLEFNSGMELTETPFDLVHYNKSVIYEVIGRYHADGTKVRIRTTAYQLQMI